MIISVLTIVALIRSSLQQLRGRGSPVSYNTVNLPTNINKMSVNYIGQQKQKTPLGNGGAAGLAGDDPNGTRPATTGSVITFKGDEDQCCYEITSKNVKVVGSAGNHDHGSSKVFFFFFLCTLIVLYLNMKI